MIYTANGASVGDRLDTSGQAVACEIGLNRFGEWTVYLDRDGDG